MQLRLVSSTHDVVQALIVVTVFVYEINLGCKYARSWLQFSFCTKYLFLIISGISLNPEQWNQLKEQISDIDDAVRKL